MIQLLAFDIAGTTVEDHGLVYEALAESVRETGRDVRTEKLRNVMGMEKHHAISLLFADADGSHESVAPALDAPEITAGYARFTEILREKYAATPPTPVRGVEEALSHAREAGIKVALTTGFTAEVAALVLDGVRWKVGDDIDALITADMVPAGRPAPYLIFRAMESCGIEDVADVMAAGDTTADLLAGTRAGAGEVVGVLTGGVDREVLRNHPHTRIFESIVPAIELALTLRADRRRTP